VLVVETGVFNLDRVLGGGIPEGDVLLVVGPAGSGKTTLAFQVAFQAAAAGANTVYVSTLAESPPRLVRHLRSFSFFDERQIGERIFLFDIYPLIRKGVEPVIDAIVATANQREARLLVIDGLGTMRDLYPDAHQVRTFVYELAVALAPLACTIMFTNSAPAETTGSAAAELTISDGILVLGQRNLGTQTARTIQVQKMRGQAPLPGVHTLRLRGDGVSVYPRVESLVSPARDSEVGPARITLDLPELDGMLGGGLPRGSLTVVAGAPGTGKTLTALQYLLAGARRGERGLLLGFRESPRELIQRMRAFGMDLATPVHAGLIRIVHQVPVDAAIDEVVAEALRAIGVFAPARLVIDSVAELELIAGEERRRQSVMLALAELIHAHGTTALLTRGFDQLVGPQLDLSGSPLDVLGENLMLLRYVEFRSELYRILSVVRMRESQHDRAIRQYEIGPAGLRVLARLESAEGLLTGIAHLGGSPPPPPQGDQ
jgi:circadian clock protein KaiC